MSDQRRIGLSPEWALSVSFVLAIAAVALASTTRAAESTAGATQLAVIDDDSSAAKTLADLLTAAVGDAEFHLVERDRIDEILRELTLTADELLERDSAARLGELLPAEAFVYIDHNRQVKPPITRLRLIDTRTGILLWDELMSAATPDVLALVTSLRRAVQKVRLPRSDRRYVGVMGIVHEQSDAYLEALARALEAFVEHDLQASESVIVLEREQLNRLVQEQNLTGIEVELKASAVLIQAGIRRHEDGERVAIPWRLTRPDGTLVKSSLTTVPADAIRAREILVPDLLESLGAASAQDLVDEAEAFATRADWLISNNRAAQAFSNAYAAAAMASTRQNHARLWALHNEACKSLVDRIDWRQAVVSPSVTEKETTVLLEALRNARLAHENDWRQVGEAKKFVLCKSDTGGPGYSAFEPHVPLIAEDEPAAIKTAREELDRVCLGKYEFMKGKASPSEMQSLLGNRLELAPYFARTPDEFAHHVVALLREMDQYSLDELPFPHALRFALTAECVATRNESPNHTIPGREGWGAAAVDTICNECRECTSRGVRSMILELRASYHGDVEAAEELLKFRTLDSQTNRTVSRVLRAAGKFDQLVSAVVSEAEHRGNPSELVNWPGGFDTLLTATEASRSLAARVLPLLDEQRVDNRSRPGLRRLRDELLEMFPELKRAVPLSTSRGENPWSNFSHRFLEIKPYGEKGRSEACFVTVPDTGEAKLLIYWWPNGYSDSRNCRLQAITFSDGPAVESIVPVNQPSANLELLVRREPSLSSLSGVRYSQALSIIEPKVASYFREARLVHRDVCVTWCFGKCYVAAEGKFGVLDPATNDYTELASTLRLDTRHALDGGESYRVVNLFPAPTGDHIVLAVNGKGFRLPRPRDGLWRYDLGSGEFRRLCSGSPHAMHWIDSRLLIQKSTPTARWQLLDTTTGDLEGLAGYREPSVTEGQGRNPSIKVGKYLVGEYGNLLTRDGLSHDFPLQGRHWHLLHSLANGFLAADMNYQQCRVWQFELREDQVSQATRPARDLLANVNLAHDRLSGNWQLDERRLIGSVGSGMAKLHLPVELPEAFQLRITAIPRKGGNLLLSIAAGGAFFYIGIDHTRDGETFRSGVGAVDTKGIIDNATGVQQRVLVPNQENTVLITIRPGSVNVEANNSRIAHYEGDFARLTKERWMKSGLDWPLTLVCENSSYEFSEISLTPLEASND